MSKSKDKTEYKGGKIGKYVGEVCRKYNLDPDEVKTYLLETFPELQSKSHCNSCGASMKMWWHMLTPGLVGDLIKAIEFVKRNGKNEFHLQKNLNLSKTEFTNFQKLRYHGLITQVKGKVGFWLITKRGGAFLRNEEAIPAGVMTFRNKVEGHTPEMVRITDFKDKFPAFQSEFAYEYRMPERQQLFNN